MGKSSSGVAKAFTLLLRARGGFTLLELIIVLSILAIMASMAVTRFVDMGKKAVDVQERATISSLRTAVLLFKAVNDYWPAEIDKDGSWPSHRDIFTLLENPPQYLFLSWVFPPADGKTWAIGNYAGPECIGYLILCPHRTSVVWGTGPGRTWVYCKEDSGRRAGEIFLYDDRPH